MKKTEVDLVEFWDQSLNTSFIIVYVLSCYHATRRFPFSFLSAVSLHASQFICSVLCLPFLSPCLRSFACLKDVTNSDQKDNTPHDRVTWASKSKVMSYQSSELPHGLRSCPGYNAVPAYTILTRASGSIIIVICYDNVMLCFVPKSWARVVLLF